MLKKLVVHVCLNMNIKIYEAMTFPHINVERIFYNHRIKTND